jgi:hypothetical protein
MQMLLSRVHINRDTATLKRGGFHNDYEKPPRKLVEAYLQTIESILLPKHLKVETPGA